MNNKKLFLFLPAVVLILLSGCKDNQASLSSDNELKEVRSEAVQEFGTDEIKNFLQDLAKEGITIPEAGTGEAEIRAEVSSVVNALKITVNSLNPGYPEYPDEYITLSGILLIPKVSLGALKIVVSTPPTLILNSRCPSILFQDKDLLEADEYSTLYKYWITQSALGYAVLLPDYPGYGDSFGECYHPYVTREPMVRTTDDLLKTAKLVLAANNKRYKENVTVTGYSQGAFVAASYVQAVETNSAYNETIDLLFTGGTPANLKQIADISRYATALPMSFLYPYVMCGFNANGYSELNLGDVLQEPYASTAFEILNGINEDIDVFPSSPAELYTDNFRLNLDIDPDLAYLNDILIYNSVPIWENSCKMVMTHGTDDDTVYYQNAKDFADEQNEAGGKVTFISTSGDHTGAATYYILNLTLHLNRN